MSDCYSSKTNLVISNPSTGEMLMVFGPIELCNQHKDDHILMTFKRSILWKNPNPRAWAEMREFYELAK